MRNLKKVLALVLVFAMMLSTCVVASAASFPDVAASYQYAEAIDLLASLNILGGYEDGTFKPENNITRAEFAKVVYVIFNGMDDVNAQMYVSDSQFNDVAKNQWFNGHVNWASENSIVGGYGDGTFLPNNNVAVKEAIKMVVTAVTDKALTYPNGYIQEARALKLLEDVTVGDTSAPATRGQVAQLAYNLLFTPSRLCLVDTGTMDFYGNEILAKKAPIDFVFGLKSVKNVTLAATYNTTFLSGTSATLEEGQVELVANGTGEGYTLPAGTTYDYAGNAEDLFGQQLKAYFNSDNELVALVSVSDVVGETTAEKLVGDGTYSNPFGVTIGEYVEENNTKVYKIATVYEQRADGTWGSSSDVNLETLTGGRKFNNNNAKVTLIDTPDENEVLDGVVDTVLVEYQATTQVRRYNKTAGTISVTGKTLTFANAIGHEAFADADFSQTADPVYATYTLKNGSAGTVYTLVPTTTVEGVLTSTDALNGQLVVGGTTYKAFGTSVPTFYKDGGVAGTVVGDTVKLYLDAAGYVVAGVVTETDTVYDLNLGMVIAATDDEDRFGNQTATITVLKFDGTEETLTIDTVEETYETDNKVCVIPDGFAADGADEYVFDYNATAKDYTIVGQYVHYEVDDYDKLVDKLVVVGNSGTITPSNSVKNYTLETYDGTETYKLCYNADNGFFTSDDGLKVKASLEEVASNFTGMYFEKDAETGEVKTEYYTASNIPEFDRTGTITLVKCDDYIVAMLVRVSPDATDDKALGIITGWNTVGGEAEKNGKPTYRYAVTMLVNGESQTYYTEDLLGSEMQAIDIDYDALDNAKGLQVDYFATLNLEDGKIVVTNDNKLDVEYLGATDVAYAVATRIRNTTINATAVTTWEVPVVAGWTTDAEGRPVEIPENQATGGEVNLGGSVTLYACDETKYVYINSALTDFDGTNFGEATDGLFQKTASSKVSVGEGLELSDVTNDLYYIFAYTTFANDYNVVDNRGCLDTVFVFTTPIELYDIA